MRYRSQCLRVIRAGRIQMTCVVLIGMSLTLMAAGAVTPMGALKSSIDQVVRLLEDPELKQADRTVERRRQLEKIIGDRFSYEEMAKRSLGAHWNKLNKTQRQEFIKLFQQLLIRSYTGRIEGYSGERIQFLSERREGDYAEVRSNLLSRKGDIPVDYRLLNKSGDWRVYDIVVDGISLAQNYRGQFTNIIRTSSYEDLVEKLRNKSETFNPANADDGSK